MLVTGNHWKKLCMEFCKWYFAVRWSVFHVNFIQISLLVIIDHLLFIFMRLFQKRLLMSRTRYPRNPPTIFLHDSTHICGFWVSPCLCINCLSSNANEKVQVLSNESRLYFLLVIFYDLRFEEISSSYLSWRFIIALEQIFNTTLGNFCLMS